MYDYHYFLVCHYQRYGIKQASVTSCIVFIILNINQRQRILSIIYYSPFYYLKLTIANVRNIRFLAFLSIWIWNMVFMAYCNISTFDICISIYSAIYNCISSSFKCNRTVIPDTKKRNLLTWQKHTDSAVYFLIASMGFYYVNHGFTKWK